MRLKGPHRPAVRRVGIARPLVSRIACVSLNDDADSASLFSHGLEYNSLHQRNGTDIDIGIVRNAERPGIMQFKVEEYGIDGQPATSYRARKCQSWPSPS